MRRPCTIQLACALGVVLAATAAYAQNQQAERTQASAAIPPADSLLELRVEGPQQVRVGDSFEYQIEVTNQSSDLVVRDIRLEQAHADVLTIESARVMAPATDNQQQATNQQGQQAQQQGQKQQQQNQQQQNHQQDQQVQQQQKQQQQQAQGDQKGQWTIDVLQPRQTARIQVTAVSDKQGQAPLCVNLTSYKTGVCLATKVINPQLEITKKGPSEASLCGAFEYQYSVKNTGTGDVGTFTVRDDLPEGLKSEDGDNKVTFRVDGLKGGDVRTFVGKVRPTKAGEFKSRAIAIEQNGEKTRSQEVTTTVRETQPAVAIDGPSRHNLGRPLDYTVKVTNHGKAEVPAAQLVLHYPPRTRFTRIGDPRPAEKAVPQQQASSAEPTPASGDKSGSQPQASSQRQQMSRDQMERRSWDLGAMKPGETMQVHFTVKPREEGDLQFIATAQFQCGDNRDQALAQASATRNTELVALPALAISVVDEQDPVSSGEEVDYEILVVNEGTGEEKNVQVSAEIPQQLEYVSSSGETKGALEGTKLTFQPIEKLAAGQEVTWTVKARVKDQTGGGNLRFPVQLKSDSLSQQVAAEEPTSLGVQTAQSPTGETTR